MRRGDATENRGLAWHRRPGTSLARDPVITRKELVMKLSVCLSPMLLALAVAGCGRSSAPAYPASAPSTVAAPAPAPTPEPTTAEAATGPDTPADDCPLAAESVTVQ